MFKDKDGKFCLAKTAFAATLLVMLYNMAMEPETFNYRDAAMFLGAVGAVYWGRNNSKDMARTTQLSDANNRVRHDI
jgi:hypothetical protein